jgi:hypothetical protein
MAMRILDIGVAAAYAVLCVSLISYMGPYAVERQSAQSSQDSAAGSAVLGYVSSVGMPFLSSAEPSQICASLDSASNSTTVFGGSVAGYPCGGAPSSFLGSSSVAMTFSGRQVEIEAWVVAAQ